MISSPPQFSSLQIQSAITSLASPLSQSRQQAQSFLQASLHHDQSSFFQCIFAMIRQSDAKCQLLAIAYLRHCLHSIRHRLPDLSHDIYQVFRETCDNRLGECLSIFFNKSAHLRYKREFASLVANGLVVGGVVDWELARFVVAVYEGPLEAMTNGRVENLNTNMGRAPQSFHIFIHQYSSLEPENLCLWIKTIISLSTSTSLPPPLSFIYRNLLRQAGLDLPCYLNLLYFYNQIHYKMTNLEEVYNLIVRVSQITARQSMVEQMGNVGVQGSEILLKAIRNMLGDAFKCKAESVGEAMMMESLTGIEVWKHYMMFLVRVMSYYRYQSYELIDICAQIIRIFNTNLPEEKLRECMKQMGEWEEEAILFLLSTMPRLALEAFNATALLMDRIHSFFSKHHRKVSSLFLEFVIRYVMVYEYFPSTEVQEAVHSFAITICTSQIEGLVDSLEGFKLKAQGLNVLCRMQRFNIDKSPENKNEFCLGFIQQLLALLREMGRANILENSAETMEIIIDGLEYLTSLPLFSSILNTELIRHLLPLLQSSSHDRPCDEIYMLINFLRFITLSLDCKNDKICPQILQITRLALNSKNLSLQTEACELFLKIVYTLNHSLTHTLGHSLTHTLSQEIQDLVNKCQILTFIESKLALGEDEPIYSKIMIELMVHEAIFPQISHLLLRLSQNPELQGYLWYYSRLWEPLVILWDVENDYTTSKGLNKKIGEIREGNCERMLESMSIEDQDYYMRQVQNSAKRVFWLKLADVKPIVESGSAAGLMIEDKLNQGL